MFEKYDEMVVPEAVAEAVKNRNGFTQKKQVVSYLAKYIPLEKYFQQKVMDGIRKHYPDAYVVKISLAHYSTAGIPDVMVVYKGHYFGFEIKRPVLRSIEPSKYNATKLQLETMKRLQKSGGTCKVVSYPEEAIAVMKKWESGG